MSAVQVVTSRLFLDLTGRLGYLSAMWIGTPLGWLLVWASGCAFEPYVPECDSGERLEQAADEGCDTG